MTTRADLLALADRVEREEPSVELDGYIAVAINEAPGITGRLWRYTTSLDAAASLAKYNWTIALDHFGGENVWRVSIYTITGDLMTVTHAPTEPRARTAAALRARAQEMKDE